MSATPDTEVAPVADAARQWVEAIRSHPNWWASAEDTALIRAVRTAFPDIECAWLTDPEYAGWTDGTKPAQSDAPGGAA
jgi:hypothetical protein